MFLSILESPKPLLYDKRSLKSILSIQRERPGKECENYEKVDLAGFIQRGLHMILDVPQHDRARIVTPYMPSCLLFL